MENLTLKPGQAFNLRLPSGITLNIEATSDTINIVDQGGRVYFSQYQQGDEWSEVRGGRSLRPLLRLVSELTHMLEKLVVESLGAGPREVTVRQAEAVIVDANRVLSAQ